MKEGDLGTITFGDNTSSRIEFVKECHVLGYWLKYVEGETHRPLSHPDFGTEPSIISEILLPPFLFDIVVKMD